MVYLQQTIYNGVGGYRGTSGDHTVTQVRRDLFPPRGTLGGESCVEVASREVTFRRGLSQPEVVLTGRWAGEYTHSSYSVLFLSLSGAHHWLHPGRKEGRARISMESVFTGRMEDTAPQN